MKTLRTSLAPMLGLCLLATPSMAQEQHHVRIEMEHSVNGNTQRVVKEFTAPSEAAMRDSLMAITHEGLDGGTAMLGVGLAGHGPADKADQGARIVSVTPGSPADKAGLRTGDVITSMDGTAVFGPEGVMDLVRSHEPGDRLELAYLRDGKRNTVDVTLAERKTGNTFPGDLGLLPDPGMSGAWATPKGAWPNARAYLGVRPGKDQGASGAQVGAVEPNTAAARMGIQQGDRITALNNEPVTDFGDLAQSVAAHAPGDSITVTVDRGGQEKQLSGTLGERNDGLAWSGMMRGMRPFRWEEPQGMDPGVQEQLDQLQEQMEQLRKQMEDLKAAPGP